MDEQFIETVKKYPCLWNTSLNTYKCNDVKDAAWEHVVSETQLSDVKTAKTKWKKLRDSYRDALKRKNATRSGQSSKQIREWKFEKVMEFLIPYMTNRERATNYSSQTHENEQETNSLQSNDDLETSSETRSTPTEEHSPLQQHSPSQASSVSSSASRSSKRKSEEISDLLIQHYANRERLRQEKQEMKSLLEKNNTLDDMDTFFLSISRILKKLSPFVQLQAKRKIFNAVLEAEELELQNSLFNTNENWYSSGYTSASGSSLVSGSSSILAPGPSSIQAPHPSSTQAPGPSSVHAPGPSSVQAPGASSTQAQGPSLEDPHMTDEELEQALGNENLNSTYEEQNL